MTDLYDITIEKWSATTKSINLLRWILSHMECSFSFKLDHDEADKAEHCNSLKISLFSISKEDGENLINDFINVLFGNGGLIKCEISRPLVPIMKVNQ